MSVGDWTIDELSKGLVGHLRPELIQTLKDQKISGAYFLKLTDSTLKLFNFDLVDIIDIVTLISDINSGNKVLTLLNLHQNDFQHEKENIDPNTSGTSHAENYPEDVILRQFVKAEYIESRSPYDLKNLRGICRNWKRLQDLKLPGTSRPNLAIPASMWIESEEEDGPPKKKKKATASSASSRKSERLIKPVENTIFVPSGDVSDEEENADLTTGFDALLSSDMYKLPESVNFLTSDQLTAQQIHLPKFDIEKILLENESTKCFVPHLRDGFLFICKYRKLIFRTLMRYLCYIYVDHPVKVNTSMKEGLSKSFIVAFPQYRKVVNVPNQTPWSHVVAHFQNIYKRILGKLPSAERPRKGKVSKQKVKKVAVKESAVDITLLGIINADKGHRDEILGGMKETFSLRVAERLNGSSITEIIQKYPHFLSYSGEVIALEFDLMYPKAADMCRIVIPLIDKILKNFSNPRLKINTTIDGLRAFFLVASKLPRCIDKGTPPLPVEEEIVVTMQVGVDIDEAVETRRQHCKKSVQPYLIAVKGTTSKEVLKYFLVLDSRVMELGRVPFVRAVDWLFKSFWVFNVHYPNSWKAFFKFLQTCVYQIFHDPSEDVPPSAQALFSRLLSL